MRTHPPALALPVAGPAVRGIVVALLAVFVAQVLFAYAAPSDAAGVARVNDFTALSLDAIRAGRVWVFVTYAVVHSLAGWGHLFLNLLLIYLFGASIEADVGSRRTVGLFAASAIGAALAFLLAAWLPDPFGVAGGAIVGASGAAYGLVGAVCMRRWRTQTLSLIFVTIDGRTLAALLVLLELIRGALGAGAEAVCHLGGIATGLALASGRGPTRALRDLRDRLRRDRLRRKLRVVHSRDVDERPPTFH